MLWVGQNPSGGGGGVSFPLFAPDGSAAAPQYSFAAAHGTGIYRDGNGQVSFTNAGNEGVTLQADGTVQGWLASGHAGKGFTLGGNAVSPVDLGLVVNENIGTSNYTLLADRNFTIVAAPGADNTGLSSTISLEGKNGSTVIAFTGKEGTIPAVGFGGARMGFGFWLTPGLVAYPTPNAIGIKHAPSQNPVAGGSTSTEGYLWTSNFADTGAGPQGLVFQGAGAFTGAVSSVAPNGSGTLTGQVGVGLRERFFGQTTVGGTATFTFVLPFDFANNDAGWNGMVQLTGVLTTAGVGGGTVGRDVWMQRFFIKGTTVGGVAVLLDSSADSGETVVKSASFVGATIQFAAAGSTLHVTVNAAPMVSGVGAVVKWQLEEWATGC